MCDPRWGDVLKGRSSLDSLEFWHSEMDTLQEWLFERLAWLDGQLLKPKLLPERLSTDSDRRFEAAGR